MRWALLSIALLVACDAPAPGDTLPSCRVDSDCDDGLFCNGAERCDPRTPLGCLPGAPPCAMGCDERIGCVACEPPDGDGDGARARGCGGPDCDDTDPDVAPGAAERCDGGDDDCDGRVDEELEAVYLDADGDGHGDPETALGACTTLPAAAAGDDCDDDDPDVHPGAADTCDGRDDDCSGVIDDGAPETLCALPGVASATCDAGHCTLVRCDDGRGDCDGRVANGCEISTASDVHHCGACDAPCSGEGTVVCAAGACELAVCPAGRHVCGDRCLSDFSTESCGPSCTPCERSSAHGGAHCDGYRCTTYCDPGYATNTETGGLECLWASSRLVDLVPSEGTLTPRLTEHGHHVLQVSATTEAIRFTPVTDPRAVVTIEIAGVTVAANELSPPFPLRPGSTPVIVHVTSPAGAESSYVLEVRRGELSGSDLAVSTSGELGTSLAAQRALLVGGAPHEAGGGAVRVFAHDGTAWIESERLTASNADPADGFGHAVALDGDRLAVGATGEDGGPAGGDDDSVTNAGAVYVFRHDTTGWVEEAYLKGAAPHEGEHFGSVLALSGDLLAVGQPWDGAGGVVDVFRRTGTGWAREAHLEATSPAGTDAFGAALAFFGGVLLVGAPHDDGPDDALPSSGAVHVFAPTLGTWSPIAYLQSPRPVAGEQLGAALAVGDGWIAVGAPYASGVDPATGRTAIEAGAVHLWRGPSWAHVGVLHRPLDGAAARFGRCLAAADGGLVVGTLLEAIGFELDGDLGARTVWSLGPATGDVAATPAAFFSAVTSASRIRATSRMR